MVRKLSRGQQVKIAAKDYNRWQDAGLSHAMAKLNQQELPVAPDSLEGVILVKNTTAMHLPRFSILGLNGSIYDPNYDTQARTEFKNQIALKGEMPSTTTAGKFCVLQNDAVPGEVVAAMVSGVTPCLLNIGSASDTHADVETDTAVADRTRYLKTGTSGSGYILFKPLGLLGEQLGVVRISNISSADQVNMIQLDHDASARVLVEPLETGTDPYIVRVHPGIIRTPDGSGGYGGTEECWVQFAEDFAVFAGLIIAVNQNYYGPLRKSGTFDFVTNEGEIDETHDERPLYVGVSGEWQFVGKCDSPIAQGATGTVRLYNAHVQTDSGIDKEDCLALAGDVTEDMWVQVNRVGSQWLVTPLECELDIPSDY